VILFGHREHDFSANICKQALSQETKRARPPTEDITDIGSEAA